MQFFFFFLNIYLLFVLFGAMTIRTPKLKANVTCKMIIKRERDS